MNESMMFEMCHLCTYTFGSRAIFACFRLPIAKVTKVMQESSAEASSNFLYNARYMVIVCSIIMHKIVKGYKDPKLFG